MSAEPRGTTPQFNVTIRYGTSSGNRAATPVRLGAHNESVSDSETRSSRIQSVVARALDVYRDSIRFAGAAGRDSRSSRAATALKAASPVAIQITER
jgi:hypothetical protein